MVVEICFDAYLRSVVSAYQQWWRLYTLTDATGRESQRVESDRIAPAFFDFGLMVQTVESPKAEQERELESDREKKEKIERLPVLEGICKYAAEHVLLLGRPGAGKSTALARLLLQEAENALSIARDKIPVLVELRYLPSEANESSVCDRILAFMHKHDPALDIDEAGIKQLLRQGRLLLLVDGVNELPSDRGRVMVNQFRELYQKTCPMIFTTRELSAGGDLGIAKRLEMQPLTEPQMQQFVMAYLPTQGERLLRQLSGRLREFGQTPLLLWMLCSLFQQSEQIPPNLGMVFRAFTVGYGDRIKQDVTLSNDARAWWGRLLQYLAFKMTCGESLTELQVAISRREAEQFLVEFLRGKVEFADDCAVRWLEDLLKHHLIQISNDRIEFRHQLIQEYYAAEWLLGLLPSLSDARLRQGYLNYLKWTEPLALMLELVEGEEQAVRVVRLALEVDLRLGARFAGAVKYGFQEKTVGLLIREIEEREIPNLFVIELLGETRSNAAINNLVMALKYSAPNISDKAREALGILGNEKIANDLITLLKDSNPDIREIAVELLSEIDNQNARDLLIDSIKDPSSNVRKKVAELLSKISSKKSVDTLVKATKDNDSDVRINAAKSLVEIDYGIGESHFRTSVKYKRVKPLVIGNLKLRQSETLLYGIAFDVLMTLVKDPNSDVRFYVLWQLGEMGKEEAMDTLINALGDSDDRVRSIATRSLTKIGSEKVVETLVNIIKDPNSDIYEQALKALIRIDNEKVINLLVSCTESPDLETRWEALEALGEIGNETAIDILINFLKDSDYTFRWKAVSLLGHIGNLKSSVKAHDAILPALKDSHSDVRCQAAIELGHMISTEAIDPLVTIAMTDSSSSVRNAAISAISEIGSISSQGEILSEQAIEFLVTALKDPDADIRQCAVHGLTGNKQTVDALITAITDSDVEVRRVAAKSLGYTKYETAIDCLINAVRDSDFQVSWNALESLGNIGGKKAVDALIAAIKDSISFTGLSALLSLDKSIKDDRILPTLTQQLPYLLTLIPTEASQPALSVITAIQARCKYYNYAIAQTPLPPEDKTNPTTGNTYIFNEKVGQVVAGNLEVHGDNIGTQNN